MSVEVEYSVCDSRQSIGDPSVGRVDREFEHNGRARSVDCGKITLFVIRLHR